MLTNSNINKTAVHWKYSVAVLAITSGFRKTEVFEEFFQLIKYYFTVEPLRFYYTNKSPWSELSNGILVDVWVWNLTPNQLFCPPDPAIASSISFWYVLCRNSQRHQPTPPGAETIPSISSWFELSVSMVSAPGVVGWWRYVWQHNTMPNRLQNGWIGGAIFTSSMHLLAPPWQKSIACVHRLELVSQWVWHRCHIGRCLCRSGEDVSAMHRWLIIH